MCDLIQFFRIFLFVICWVVLVSAVFYANAYCKKKGVDMNTFSGMFELWGMVFNVELTQTSSWPELYIGGGVGAGPEIDIPINPNVSIPLN